MGAAAPVLFTVAKVAGTALAVKSIVEGIKEGNLVQAGLGAVGAYVGLNSLGAFGTQAAALGTGAADQAALASGGTVAGQQAAQQAGAQAAAGASAASGGLAKAPVAGSALGTAASEATNQATYNAAQQAASGGLVNQAAGGGGFLKPVGDFVRDNKELVLVGGMGLQGYAQGKAREKEQEREEEFYKDELRRRGAPAQTIDAGRQAYIAQRAQQAYGPPASRPIIRRTV